MYIYACVCIDICICIYVCIYIDIYIYIYTVGPLMDTGHRIQDTCHRRDYTGHSTNDTTPGKTLSINSS